MRGGTPGGLIFRRACVHVWLTFVRSSGVGCAAFARSQLNRRSAVSAVNDRCDEQEESGSIREALQRLIRQAINVPALDMLRAETQIEIDRKLVPFQDLPLHSAAIARDRYFRECREKGVSDAFTARLRDYEKVFEIEAALAEECRVVVVEEGKADRNIAVVSDEHLRGGISREQCATDTFLSDDTGFLQPLVFRETTDKRYDERNVALGGGNDSDCDRRGTHGGIIELAPGTVNDIFPVE